MSTRSATKPKPDVTTAKLFQNGRSQAVRLPKQFRFEGDEVRVRRTPEGVLLEPIKKIPSREEVRAWFAKMDNLNAGEVIPGGRNQGICEPRDIFD